MRPRKNFPTDAAAELKLLLAKATDIREQWRILALLIRAAAPQVTASQIAVITGLSPNYVAKIHSQFLRHGAVPFAYRHGRGGHRHGAETEKSRVQRLQRQKQEARRALFQKYRDAGMQAPVARMKIELEEELRRPVDEAHVLRVLKQRGYYQAGGHSG